MISCGERQVWRRCRERVGVRLCARRARGGGGGGGGDGCRRSKQLRGNYARVRAPRSLLGA